MSRILLTVTILGAVLAFAGQLLGSGWEGITVSAAGAVAAMVAAVIQFRQGEPYIRQISVQDWVKAGEEFQLVIPATTHRKGHGAGATFYIPSQAGWEQAVVDTRAEADGTIRLGIDQPFEGRVVIR